MNQDEIKKQLEVIEKAYDNYMKKMHNLKKEQNKVLDEFLHELEKAKMEELRSKLG